MPTDRPIVPTFDGTTEPVRAVLAMLGHDLAPAEFEPTDDTPPLFTESGKPIPFPGGNAR